MPELPEVETYARDLARRLPGLTFTGARIGWPNQLPKNDPLEFGLRLAGQRVLGVDRRGKLLRIRLEHDWLLIHLKMSGSLTLVAAETTPDRHAHAVLEAGERELRFRDPRKFGRLYLVADDSEVIGKLGPEPWDESITPETFAAALGRRSARLKPLLLDQTFLAGLGNIYVDESLWAAELHPLTQASRVTALQAARLLAAIRQILETAIAAGGATLSRSGFRRLDGSAGAMFAQVQVFRRTGEACPRCAKPIERIVVGQRSTHICPGCQRRL
jgi:formamidopyrimidine-DNA glycosylase